MLNIDEDKIDGLLKFSSENKYSYKNTMICPNCKCDTNIPMVLGMVIPPCGLACPNCKTIVVRALQVTC